MREVLNLIKLNVSLKETRLSPNDCTKTLTNYSADTRGVKGRVEKSRVE